MTHTETPADQRPAFALFEAPAPKRKGGGQSAVYPFAHMEVAQAFDAPDDMGKRGHASNRQNSIVNCARGYAKKHNPTARFATRTHDGFVRCHRVA